MNLWRASAAPFFSLAAPFFFLAAPVFSLAMLGMGCSSSTSDGAETPSNGDGSATSDGSTSSDSSDGSSTSSDTTATNGTSGTVGATTGTAATSDSSTPPKPTDPLVGKWTNAQCNKRSYERQFIFTHETFESIDMVSPCPQGRTCTWSGIVTRRGTFTLKGTKITLEPDTALSERGGEPLPMAMGLVDGVLVEDPSLTKCAFSKLK